MASAFALPNFIPGYRLFDGNDLQQLVAALGIQTVNIPVTLAGLANGQVLKTNVPFPFIVTTVGFRVASPATTALKLATLTTRINGVACTGGVVSLTSANCTPAGNFVAGTAITGLNVASDATTLEVIASAVTAFVEGDGFLEFTVRHL